MTLNYNKFNSDISTSLRSSSYYRRPKYHCAAEREGPQLTDTIVQLL